jgi:hypothetical protein
MNCVTASYLTGYRTVSELNTQSSTFDFEIYRDGPQKKKKESEERAESVKDNDKRIQLFAQKQLTA